MAPQRLFNEVVAGQYTDHGWSLAELGRRSGLDASLLSRLLRGEREWRLEHVEALGRALDTPARELLRGTDQEHLLTSRKDVELDADALGKRLAEALAALRSLEAEKRSLDEELKQRPSRAEHETLQRQLMTAERDRKELERVTRELERVTRQHEALRTKLVASDAKAQALETAYADLVAKAEKTRQTAKKWQEEAKRLGSNATIATVGAFVLGNLLGTDSRSSKRRRR